MERKRSPLSGWSSPRACWQRPAGTLPALGAQPDDHVDEAEHHVIGPMPWMPVAVATATTGDRDQKDRKGPGAGGGMSPGEVQVKIGDVLGPQPVTLGHLVDDSQGQEKQRWFQRRGRSTP